MRAVALARVAPQYALRLALLRTTAERGLGGGQCYARIRRRGEGSDMIDET
jgi:hypothetical protein